MYDAAGPSAALAQDLPATPGCQFRQRAWGNRANIDGRDEDDGDVDVDRAIAVPVRHGDRAGQ